MDNPARIPAPNYTQIPNAIFDLMADKDAGLTEKELKVLLAIARKTFGWHKKRDKISLSQLAQLTAMSRTSVVAGIRAAIKRGIVRQTPDPKDRLGGMFYELVVDDIDQVTSTNSELVQNLNQSKINTRTSTNSELELVQNLNTQKKEKEKKERESGNADRAPAVYHHPAVVSYSNLTGRAPNRTSAEMIATQVKDVAKWEQEIARWLASDFKPGNVVGMLDWYHGKGRHQNNGGAAPLKSSGPIVASKPNIASDAMTPAERAEMMKAYKHGTPPRTPTK